MKWYNIILIFFKDCITIRFNKWSRFHWYSPTEQNSQIEQKIASSEIEYKNLKTRGVINNVCIQNRSEKKFQIKKINYWYTKENEENNLWFVLHSDTILKYQNSSIDSYLIQFFLVLFRDDSNFHNSVCYVR